MILKKKYFKGTKFLKGVTSRKILERISLERTISSKKGSKK